MAKSDSIEVIRSRLASRQSFFGGPVCTRQQSKALSWKELPRFCPKAQQPGIPATAAHRKVPYSKPSLDHIAHNRDFSHLGDSKKQPIAPARCVSTCPVPEQLSLSQKTQGCRARTALHAHRNEQDFRRVSAATPTAVSVGHQHRAGDAQCAQGDGMSEGKYRKAAAQKASERNSCPGHSEDIVSGQQKPSSSKENLVNHNNRGNIGDSLLPRFQQNTALGIQTVQLVKRRVSLPAKGMKAVTTQTDTSPPVKITPNITHTQRQRAPPVSTKSDQAAGMQLKGPFYGDAQPPSWRRRVRTVDDESCSDLDSFIDSEDDANEDDYWRSALKETLGGYDASKFVEVDKLPDRRMQATFGDIAAEEARAARIAREVDRREAEREVAERAAKRKRRQAEGEILLSEGEGDGDESQFSSSDDESESEGDYDNLKSKRRRIKAFIL